MLIRQNQSDQLGRRNQPENTFVAISPSKIFCIHSASPTSPGFQDLSNHGSSGLQAQKEIPPFAGNWPCPVGATVARNIAGDARSGKKGEDLNRTGANKLWHQSM
jgi:hypothetical protein